MKHDDVNSGMIDFPTMMMTMMVVGSVNSNDCSLDIDSSVNGDSMVAVLDVQTPYWVWFVRHIVALALLHGAVFDMVS